MSRFAFFALIAFSGACGLHATPACVSGNDLASYVALGAGGCTVGELWVYNFGFSVVSSGGGATPVADTDIMVTTTSGPDYLGLNFASTGFSVDPGQFINYLIDYTWDPTGDIRGLGDVLDPGLVNIVTDGCVGVAFSGPSCSGVPVSVNVFQGVTSQLTDTTYFSPTNILGIRNNIGITGNDTGASFNSIENDVYLPEPGTGLLLAGALALTLWRWRSLPSAH